MPLSAAAQSAILDVSQFARAIEHSPIGTALVGLKGEWLSVNRALRVFLGYSSDELEQLTFQDLTWPEDLNLDLEQFDSLVRGEIGSYQMEKRYVRKDGEVVWAELTVSLLRDAEGQPLFFFSHVQDIRARKATEVERARLSDRIKLATKAAGIGIWDWTLGKSYMTCSPEAHLLFGWPIPDGNDADVPVNLLIESIVADDQKELLAELENAKSSGAFNAEYRICRGDGEIRVIKSVARVYRDENGAAIRLLGASTDVTELHVMAEQAEAANQAKSQFLAMMSHEIRTPMNGILGMTQVMLSGPVSDSQRSHLQVIAECGEGLVNILNDVLDLSKVEAGKLELETVDFDIGRVLNSVHATYAPGAAEKGVEVVLDLEPGMGLYQGDPTRIRQILANLVSNSVKFTERGQVVLSGRVEPQGLCLQISDTGRGMSAEVLAKIFKPFTQADASTTRTYGGTGLGLSIVHELVEMMGGRIGVESRPGQGTQFTIVLPLEQATDETSSD